MPVCLFCLTKGQVLKLLQEPQSFLQSHSVETENTNICMEDHEETKTLKT